MTERLVLFDIDGTILLTAGAGRRAVTRAVAEHFPLTDEALRVRFDGKTDPLIVMELLDASGHPDPRDPRIIADVCERYVDYLEEELTRTRDTTLLPGIVPLLEALDGHPAVVIGLLTGNVVRGARLKLASAGLDPDRFVVGAYGSDSHHRPDLPAIAASRAAPIMGRVPSGADVIIIGDTPADVTCGAGIGARPVAVATGSYRAEQLHAAGAAAVFEDLSDTARVVEAILWEASNSN
ncbi:MAG TPA: HAD family hydrolase [Anaeromyxobacteraceae bacterium]|nr:HAD family hydrolase [Anaeromyxobacteraceae bacterium]